MRIKVNSLRKFMSSFLMGIFLLSTCLPATLAEEIVHFYHNDHLGSPLAMTDEDGNVVWRRDYKPFGQEIDLGGETTFNTHTYTGKEFDAETGLYYYGARYYDPVIGRFISVDPAGSDPSNPQSWNRYVYSLNNPYRYVDPDGKLVWDVIDIACFGYSVYRFVDDPSWSTAFDLGLDAAGLLPVVPALGTMKRAGTLLQKAAKADEVLDVAKVGRIRKGKASASQGVGAFWKSTTDFRGTKVFQRNDLIDPTRVDDLGRTNLQRMQRGLAPVGPDAQPLNIHHMLQTGDGPVAEVTSTFHSTNRSTIHINPSSVSSGIDRASFGEWRKAYWKNRAKDFE